MIFFKKLNKKRRFKNVQWVNEFMEETGTIKSPYAGEKTVEVAYRVDCLKQIVIFFNPFSIDLFTGGRPFIELPKNWDYML